MLSRSRTRVLRDSRRLRSAFPPEAEGRELLCGRKNSQATKNVKMGAHLTDSDRLSNRD